MVAAGGGGTDSTRGGGGALGAMITELAGTGAGAMT
jgi:hypothetical protein